jgi:hypothetical protein
MIRWHTKRTGLIGLCAFGALGFLLGCEADVSEDCGGMGTVVSCLSVDSVTPVDIAGEPSSNVDASANLCLPEGTAEPFGDHDADVTFSNRSFPGVEGTTEIDTEGSFIVTIVNYSVTYTLNDCPSRATGCPSLTGFSVGPGQTITIPPGGTVTTTFPFVPLRVKEEYVAEGGHLGSSGAGFPFPSYTANYVFTGRTDFISSDIRVEGSAEFTIGSFNLCDEQ